MSTLYLVMRRADADSPEETPQVAFTDEELAVAHAARASTETGLPHTVRSVTLAHAPPQLRTWHSILVELQLSGEELWRHEDQLVSFSGHPDEVPGSSSNWRIIVRNAPSQPPSRIRVEVVGPDRAWCIAAARTCWGQARASHQYTEASSIEDMFADTGTD